MNAGFAHQASRRMLAPNGRLGRIVSACAITRRSGLHSGSRRAYHRRHRGSSYFRVALLTVERIIVSSFPVPVQEKGACQTGNDFQKAGTGILGLVCAGFAKDFMKSSRAASARVLPGRSSADFGLDDQLLRERKA